MSAKRTRGKRRPPARPTAAAAVARKPAVGGAAERTRREAAVRSARTAKFGIGAAAVVSAAAAMGMARVTYAGHQKHATPPLAIPQPLYAVVRQNLLQAGILAPATAPPSVVTATS
jgi:hypothetical protein